MTHFLGHMHANESWPRMRCGGHCAYCRGWFDHNRAIELGTRVLAQLDPKITGYAKHPADDERARASRVPPPDPAMHTRSSAYTVGWNFKGILLQDPWHLQGEVSRPTSSRRVVLLESGPRRPHHMYLEGQLIWNGETVLSGRKHCLTGQVAS